MLETKLNTPEAPAVCAKNSLRHCMAREAFVQFQQRPSGDYTPYLDSISRLAPDIEAARDRIERDRLMPSDLLVSS
jgi:hypothetical protein